MEKNKWNKKRNIQIDGFNWHGKKFEDELDNALDIFDKKLDDLENELDGLDDLNEDKDVSIDSNKVNEYKKISTEKDLKIFNNKIKISCKNLKIDIYNSKPNEARIKADIYIDKELNKDIKSYDIKESNLKGITNIKINEPYIKKVYVKIYLPKEVQVNLENFNSKIYSKDFCGDLNIKGSNGEVGLNGDIKECNINLINGKIKFKNNKCKSLNFNMKNGIINLDTKEKDLIINTDIRNGIVKVNKNKYINRGKNISMGKAINKINCKVLNGVININNEN